MTEMEKRVALAIHDAQFWNKSPGEVARAAIEAMQAEERPIREQAAAYREIAPLLYRLHKLTVHWQWPPRQHILLCAVEELERLTP